MPSPRMRTFEEALASARIENPDPVVEDFLHHVAFTAELLGLDIDCREIQIVLGNASMFIENHGYLDTLRSLIPSNYTEPGPNGATNITTGKTELVSILEPWTVIKALRPNIESTVCVIDADPGGTTLYDVNGKPLFRVVQARTNPQQIMDKLGSYRLVARLMKHYTNQWFDPELYLEQRTNRATVSRVAPTDMWDKLVFRQLA